MPAPTLRLRPLLGLLMGLAACGPKAPPAAPTAGIPDQPPVPAAAAPFVPPVPAVHTTPAGRSLWTIARSDLPLVSLRVVVPGGATTDPAAHPGLTAMADEMLLRGAGERDAAAFSAEAERRAIELHVWTGRRATVLEAECTADQLDAALDLLAAAVQQPRFDEDEVARLLDQQRAAIQEGLDNPRAVASELGWTLWFGADHPYGHPTGGTLAGLEGLDAAQLRASWEARVAQGARFAAVGAVDAEALAAAIDARMDALPAAETDLGLPPPGAAVVGGRPGRYLIDQPGAAQSVLRVTLPAPSAGDPRAPATALGMFVLGGSFTSRLNRLLREEKGYTYGARAWPQNGPDYGMIVASTNVFVDQTGPALADLLRLIDEARTGISDEELAKAQSGTRTEAIETAAARSSLADELVRIQLDGRPADTAARDARALAATDRSTVDALLAEIDLDKAMIVVVGDLATIRSEVEAAAPGPWIELDKHGQPVGETP